MIHLVRQMFPSRDSAILDVGCGLGALLTRLHKQYGYRNLTGIDNLPPVNQDTTNACWSYSALSFIETEMQRINGQTVKLAEMFPVYYAFIEKAKTFVATRGESRFKPGDLFTTVLEVIRTYGIVPMEVYRGQAVPRATYNHNQMEAEIETLKKQIIDENVWDETEVLALLQEILDRHLGPPPKTFTFRNKEYTPKSFAQEFVNLPWPEYIKVMSFSYAPFNTFAYFNVPDNWRKLDSYYNVPLDVFYQSMKEAIQNGYSIVFDGDIGEPGRIGKWDVCFIPDFDIPSAYINQAAREYRFDKGVTRDDHLMHMIGYASIDGQDWFLVKDSWRDAWEGAYKGYFFYHGDYVKLKVLAYLVHKDAVPTLMRGMD